MGWDTDDCIKYFYLKEYKGRLPGVDVEEDGYPSYSDLTREQYEVIEKAYWDEEERQESIWNPEYYYGTNR